LKSGSINVLEHSRPVQACNGIALPFITLHKDNKNDDDGDNNNNDNIKNTNPQPPPPLLIQLSPFSFPIRLSFKVVSSNYGKENSFKYKRADTKGGAWPPTGAQHGLNKHLKHTRPLNIFFFPEKAHKQLRPLKNT